MVLKPAILFSEDGKAPLNSDARMHRLRRGFCRSWWNPQWRDLMLAFVSWLANGNATIDLDAGMAGPIALSASPFVLETPIAFNDPPVKKAAPEEPGEPDQEAEELLDTPVQEDEEWDDDSETDDEPDDEAPSV